MTRLQDMPEVLTIAEAAVILRIGRNTAYTMARDRTLPTLACGRRIVVPKAALTNLLNASLAQAVP